MIEKSILDEPKEEGEDEDDEEKVESSQTLQEITRPVRLHRRDSTRAWLVCFSAVLSNILIFGSTFTFGVLFPVLLDEFKEGKSTTAWVGSLAVFLTMTLSPLAAKLIRRFGPRLVAIIGGIACALGLFLTSFATSIAFMYCTFGLVFGIGSSLTYTSNIDIVPKYFKRRIGLAMGIMLAGSGASFGMSLVVETLITHVGWRDSYKCLGAMTLAICITSLSFNPNVEKDEPRTSGNGRTVASVIVKHMSLKRNARFILCCMFCMIYQFGSNIPIVHLGRYAQHCGLSLSHVAHLYIGFGMSSTISRVLCGRLCDIKSLNPIYLEVFALLTIGIAVIFIPFTKDFVSILVYYCVHGFSDGVHASASMVLIIRFTHALNRTRAFGWLNQITSLGYLLGPPCGGFIADQEGSYVPVFYTSGSIILLSAAVAMALKCFKPVDSANGTWAESLLETPDNQNHETVMEMITVL